MFAVCGLQFGRSVQVQHSRQSRHRLHQEFWSVFGLPSPLIIHERRLLFFSAYSLHHRRQQLVWSVCWVPGEVCGGDWEVKVQHEQDPSGASGPHRLHRCSSGERPQERTGGLLCRVRKAAVQSVSLYSKMGSCLSFPETERWSWACPSTASKWPHWTNVWAEPSCILHPHARRLLAGRLWPRKSKWKCRTCSRDQDVLHRHPLYLIVRMLCYDDGLGAGKNLLALKTTDAQQEECSIWVYQCSSSVRINSTVSDARWPHVVKLSFLFRSRLSPSARCCRLPSNVLCPRTSPDGQTNGGEPRRQMKPLQMTAPDLNYRQNLL